MKRFIAILAAPGVKGAVKDAAPTQLVTVTFPGAERKGAVIPAESAPVHNVTGFVGKSKDNVLDRWLDWLVRASGSEPVFLIIVIDLLVWALLGIPFGGLEVWAVVISDAQAIISYIFNSLLMRQQLNGYDTILRVSASLRSRNLSHRRMLREILRSGQYKIPSTAELNSNQTESTAQLPTENWVGRISTLTSRILGHFATVCLYWVGIIIWISFGQYSGWSNEWQLHINSATSGLMVLIFAFLANIREHHNTYIERCLNSIFEVDSAIELKLRTMTGDTTPNPTIVIPAPKVNKLQRAIFYYADLVGTLVGVAILIIVVVVWLSIGAVLSFNSNWWLLIGTYAGLVGLNDGFVLRNVQFQLNAYENGAFEEANLEDLSVFAGIGLPDAATDRIQDNSFSHRLSAKMGIICAHEITVVLGVVLIFGLIAGASAMKWSITGQLLANVPPSIIESFFMVILITGHNLADSSRRADLQNMYLRRLKLLAYLDRLELSTHDQSRGCNVSEANK
ncbi:hypothetical protein RRF57_004533 [Xylaria bambusicola]|uniref:Low affinity iron permease n=1 Tax=Xylaria bambusicola TaxID=326684 RepID=A0AAN7UJC7_9PEZI